MTSFVLPLDDSHAGLERVGGKGASLAKLAVARLPVPGGFHVTTDAYRSFVEANDLEAVIEHTPLELASKSAQQTGLWQH